MIIEYILTGILAFLTTYLLTSILIPRLKAMGITGTDQNKEDKPSVAEMGGFAIVGGSVCGIFLAIFFHTFFGFEFDLVNILAALITILLIAFLGVVDDILDIPQLLKAFLPLGAAIPLVAVCAVGSTMMIVPFIGEIDLGIFYIIVLVPVGVAVASNLTNMFAGFNGMETGIGIVIFATTSLLAFSGDEPEMLIISIAMLGALMGFFFFNKLPSKVFPGDVGNLSIGAVLACTVIIGNYETAGAILTIPYVLDFFIKAMNGFPSKGWQGIYKNGKLFAPERRVSLAQHLMKASGGISERKLVSIFIGSEIILALAVLFLYF